MAVEIKFKSNLCFSYSQHLNKIPFLDEITLVNHDTEDTEPARLVLYAQPCFLRPYVIDIPALSPGGVFVIQNFAFDYDAELLASFNEAIEAVLFYEYQIDGRVLYKNEYKVDLRPYDECSNYLSHAPLRAAFVTPNHPKITELVTKISDRKGEKDHSYSIVGYQWGKEDILKTVECMFDIVKEEEIAYVLSKNGFHLGYQRIRLVDEVFANRQANCMDMTYLFTSILEALGLNPLIVITETHAFAGFWLNDEKLSQPVNDDANFLKEHTKLSDRKIVIFECTLASKGSHATFSEACDHVLQLINENENAVNYVVDVKAARKEGIVPLPARSAGTVWKLFDPNAGSGETDQDGSTSNIKFEYPSVDEYELEFEEEYVEDEDTKAAHADDEDSTTEYLLVDDEEKEYKLPRKIDRWKNKLLDISASSPLLNIKIQSEGNGSAVVLTQDALHLYRKVRNGKRFFVEGQPTGYTLAPNAVDFADIAAAGDVCKTAIEESFAHQMLHLHYKESDVTKVLSYLKNADRNHREQNGAGILYMTFGTLKWTEVRSGKVCYAPVLLVPMLVEKQGSHYQLSYEGTEIFFNAAIIEMLKSRFDLHLPEFTSLLTGEEGYPDMEGILKKLEKACYNEADIKVNDYVSLGLFAFSQYLMWNDLKQYEEYFMNHPIVKSMIDGNLAKEVNDSVEEVEASEVLLPIKADASQIKAIQRALGNESLVLHGPPGTGKSQTITAMLSNFIGYGKSVLFAAEKAPALQVVYNRMKAIHLDEFCLYLPANTTRKSDTERFLSQYAHLMEIAEKPSTEYEVLREKIEEEKARIQTLLDVFKIEDANGYSLEELLSECFKTKHPETLVPVGKVLMEQLQNSAYDSLHRMLKDTMYMGSLVGDIKEHPLKKWENLRYEYGIQKAMRESSRAYLELLRKMKAFDDQMKQAISEDVAFGRYGQHDLKARYTAMSCASLIPEHLRAVDDLLDKIEQWNRYQDAVPDREWFAERAKPEFMELNLERLKAKWDRICHKTSSMAKLERLDMKAELKPYIVKSGFTDRDLTEIIDAALKLRELNKEVPLYMADSLNLTKQQAKELKDQLLRYYPSGVPEIVKTCTKEDEELAKQGLKLLEEHEKVCKDLRIIFGNGVPCWNGKDDLAIVLEEVAHWTDGLDTIREWCDYQLLREDCKMHGLLPWIELFESGMDSEAVLQNYKTSCKMASLKAIYHQYDEVRKFAGYRFDNMIHNYEALMNEFYDVCAKEIRCRKLREIAELLADPAYNAEKVMLKKLIESAGKGYTIRSIMNRIGSYLMKMTSCVMATPMSVAVYFAPDAYVFDHVVTDEASQLQTCKSVGLIVRGKSSIVVGDPNQMPPTSFFESYVADEKMDTLEEDQESILKDFIALDMPNYYLKWHYRSNHESLITYSNHKYYGGKMITFPSSGSSESKVRLIRTNGIYDRGHSMTNKIEAKALVDYLEQKLEDGDTRSYGVVAFNKRQQMLIERLIEKRSEENSAMQQALLSMKEKGEELFVRNLESVQGDERDVILFTIGFGPDEEGKILMSFGPLAKAGGWRRLNVAITRSRDEMVLFTSMDSSQMIIHQGTSRGVCDLRDFIAYAENQGKDYRFVTTSETAAILDETADDGFAKQICAYIKELGYSYVKDVGTSSLKIDIAIQKPDSEGEYLLGIMLNSKAINGEFSVYDSEVGQCSILKKHGWNLLRVWSLDWMEDSEREKRRIFNTIKDVDNG